ncbi:MAG: hypothetical protein GY782_11425, partial [Gammaproteobacteria bacterium]|nr:hypothetical protein [Gammaproteobacteria bacterium]
MASRLQRLEQLMQNQTVNNANRTISPALDVTESSQDRGSSGDVVELEEGEAMGKEKSIEITFGDDTSPNLLEKFIAHYSLVDRINKARGVRVWKKPEYRALMLRLALRGPASEFVENAEQIMLSLWV